VKPESFEERHTRSQDAVSGIHVDSVLAQLTVADAGTTILIGGVIVGDCRVGDFPVRIRPGKLTAQRRAHQPVSVRAERKALSASRVCQQGALRRVHLAIRERCQRRIPKAGRLRGAPRPSSSADGSRPRPGWSQEIRLYRGHHRTIEVQAGPSPPADHPDPNQSDPEPNVGSGSFRCPETPCWWS
jgi:hypothetical protein